MEVPHEESIQVYVRVKPSLDDSTLVFNSQDIKLERHQFSFDKVFGPQSTHEEIFASVGYKLIERTIDGYNGCVFVYGQTGSGKTHTMMGDQNGLMQRSFVQLFEKIERMNEADCAITCSYFQLYNQQIIDLLDPKKERRLLNIRQDIKKGVFVENLSEEAAFNASKLLDCLNCGMKNRHIGETLMNRESSRSHSIFTISLSCRIEQEGKKVLKTPKLHFVDLAGSERQRQTMSTGERLKEAGNINKSLTTLGMVINALASEKAHVPYRDSKLTCLLRDSLGGNSKTFLVATVSSSILCFQETLSTLNFAKRVKMVKVRALINEESLSTNVEHYKAEIRKLKLEIQLLQNNSRETVGKASCFDEYLGRINDTISKISFQLQENIHSPLIGNLPTSLEKSSFDFQGQEDLELTQYLSATRLLLSQMNGRILEVRQEVRGAFPFSRARECIKSPSRLERDHYEKLVGEKEDQIIQLETKCVNLHDQLLSAEVKIRDLTRRCEETDKNANISSLRQELLESYTVQDSLRAEVEKYVFELRKFQLRKRQLENQIKEMQSIREQNQQQLEYELQVRSSLKRELKQIQEKFMSQESGFQNWRRKALDSESREESLRTELQIISASNEFSSMALAELNQKVSYFKEENKNYQLELSQIRQQASIRDASHQQQIYQLALRRDEAKLKMQLLQVEHNQVLSLHSQLTFDRLNEKKTLADSWKQLAEAKAQTRQAFALIESLQLQLRKVKGELESSNHEFKKALQLSKEEVVVLEVERNTKMSQLAQCWGLYETEKRKVVELEQANQLINETTAALKLEFNEAKSRISAGEKAFLEHEQLQKSYRELLRDNYVMRTKEIKVPGCQVQTDLEMKVDYYEEKFNLMSLEHKKASEAIQKLKNKQIALNQQLSFYRERASIAKITDVHQGIQKAQAEELKKENYLLKQQLAEMRMGKLGPCSQKQADLKAILLEAVQFRGQKKQNCHLQSLEELFSAWREMDEEGRQRLAQAEKCVKREERLKVETRYIVKENSYLRQQLSTVTKELEMAKEQTARPRKLIKLD